MSKRTNETWKRNETPNHVRRARKMSREFASVYNALARNAKPETTVTLQLLTDLTYRTSPFRPGETVVEVIVAMVGRTGQEIASLFVELECRNHLQHVYDSNRNLLVFAVEDEKMRLPAR